MPARGLWILGGTVGGGFHKEWVEGDDEVGGGWGKGFLAGRWWPTGQNRCSNQRQGDRVVGLTGSVKGMARAL